MTTGLQGLRAKGLVLALALLLAGCASGPPSLPADIAQRIETASTRSDHELIADYYLAESVGARASADRHRKLASSYRAQVSQRGGGSMVAHCNAIVKSQENIAGEYESLAAAHREMARQAKP